MEQPTIHLQTGSIEPISQKELIHFRMENKTTPRAFTVQQQIISMFSNYPAMN